VNAAGAAVDAAASTQAWRERTLGVLGGGQLGRMFVHAAQAAGWRVVVLEPDAGSPAGAAADEHLVAAYDDASALDRLAARCVAVTTEFENVPAAALERLAARCRVAPHAAAVRVCQNRLREKQLFVDAGVHCAPFTAIATDDDVLRAAAHFAFPALLKTAELGYDGKGQKRVDAPGALAAAWAALGRVPCVLEQRLALARELSVVVARAADGQCVHLPVQQNLHREGILAVTEVPAPGLPPALAASAVAGAQALAARLAYVGVLCVEFFVLDDGTLVANEMAPRPHNSGHASIDACDLSQFELQLRVLAGWPLVMPRQHSAAVMLNLLGDLWFDALPRDAAAPAPGPHEPDWPAVLALPGVHLHLYGKSEPRRGRKMGHLTVTAAHAEQAQQLAAQAARALGLPAPA
jgi:5-(carboxyamino)imidazole ribonucleotide synthase